MPSTLPLLNQKLLTYLNLMLNIRERAPRLRLECGKACCENGICYFEIAMATIWQWLKNITMAKYGISLMAMYGDDL